MNVLIIGNGFDLAHGLPTGYNDFLDFSKIVKQIYTYDKQKIAEFCSEHLEKIAFPKYVKDEIYKTFQTRDVEHNAYLEEYAERLDDNIWYEYFLKIIEGKLIKGVNWIDFESEIRDIIKYFDETEVDISENYEIITNRLDMTLRNGEFTKYESKLSIFDELLLQKKMIHFSIKDVRKRLYQDLRRLTRALEIYISHFVSKIECKVNPKIKQMNVDHVVSFNYSNTFSRIYDDRVPVTYIHGEAFDKAYLPSDKDYDLGLKKCNLVLGIDEYWENDNDIYTKNKYTIFKKFAQRIVFGTGEENNLWYSQMQDNYEREKNLVMNSSRIFRAYSSISVFGHSLDVTDKDILGKYIGAEFTNVTVYCKDTEAEGELISNIISLIGEQKLIEKVYNVLPSLKFVVLQ
ncbi:AbiH family protein [Butyrivibrio hungatei]|uniref:AbiH-like protein n=1 Tax=Butyrivibrio hungatei TaxID=185008 RepID=A0A1D9NYL2_9FIRM|nr:AbiH family protein [Butyrivibrio hungatei]AOZ95466.1 AbiH-like protein [Butyrivibrio hungatei]